jgi:hypothetical protein
METQLAHHKTKKGPTRRAFFDFETFGWTPDPDQKQIEVQALCVGFKLPGGQERFIHDRSQKRGKELAEQALMWMFKQDVDEWWAHYAGNFDALQLVAAARRMHWRIEMATTGGIVLGVSMKPSADTHHSVEIRDLYRVLSMKLARIAEDFELPSRKVFQAYDYQGDMRTLPVDKLRLGCLVDCRIGMEALEKVETLLGTFGGKLKMTFSASALTVVQSHLKEKGVRLPSHRSENPTYVLANIAARAGYYGARVEVFNHTPKNPLREWDVNSSYPWSMTQTMPTKWKATVERKLAREAYEAGVEGIYTARINVPRMWLPPLPYRPHNGGLYFPIGRWEASFPRPELAYAESLGCTVEIQSAILYESANIFADYVAHLFELKRTSKGAVRELAKFLLNGSYGKFAEKPERERIIIETSEIAALHYALENEGVRILDEDLDPCILTQESIRYARHVHYGIGSYITAHSRILWHRFALQMKNLAYGDTDSFHAESWKGEASDALGGLKLELADFRGKFYAPKLYSLHELDGQYLVTDKGNPKKEKVHVACKGFPKGSIDDFEAIIESARTQERALKEGETKKRAKELAQKAGVHLVKTRLMRTQVRADDAQVVRIRQSKSWSGLSKKRKPFEDGSTEPWSVSELNRGRHLKARCPAL